MLNKKINIAGGTLQLEKLSIKSCEKKQTIKGNCLMNFSLKIPTATGRFLNKLGWFFTKPYKHNLNYMLLTIRGKFIADQKNKEFFDIIHNKDISLLVSKEEKSFLSYDTIYQLNNQNSIDYEKSFKILKDQYIPDNIPDNQNILFITIKDNTNEEIIKFEIKPEWEIINYNFFKKENSLKISQIYY